MTAALALPAPPEWMSEGLCGQTDPDLFYPDKGGSVREAKGICNGSPLSRRGEPRPPCPVREHCLRYALDNDERYGIWGGVSERDRRRMRAAMDRRAA